MEGNLPTRELFARPRNVRDDIVKRDGGTVPDNLLPVKVNIFSVEILPKLSGILPTKLFSVIRRSTRDESFPIEEGIFPEI